MVFFFKSFEKYKIIVYSDINDILIVHYNDRKYEKRIYIIAKEKK